MSGTDGRPPRVTLARDAVDFVDRVERIARERGADEPCLNHWVAAACDRPFLARTLAREADVLATRELVKDALAAEAGGPPWSRDTVLELARQAAARRGDRQVRAWHLVLVVLQRFGIAGRDAEDVKLPGEELPARGTPRRARDGSDPAAPAPRPARRAADRRPSADRGGPNPGSGPEGPADETPGTRVAGPSPAPLVPSSSSTRALGLQRGAVRKNRPTPLLDQCGTDWTVLAAGGDLPPCVGRDAELRQLIEGLCRPTKPNVLLVGEPGVGKSALVEGLAARMAAGEVPDVLLGRPLIALNLSELTRDSRYYGVMEQRVGELIEEARAIWAILFLDEGHAMTGSGGREGTGDVASVFKPALARGGLSLISATTEDEYRRFIAPNGALERRFNVVRVLEPDRAAVRTMLAAHRDRIAAAHGVAVTDTALSRLVEVTASRMSHRREPDRSRDLLDQAVARAIATGADAVTPDDIEVAARAVSGAPEVTDEALDALLLALTRDGVLDQADAERLVERLGLAFAGLALHPERPKGAVLLLRRPGGPDGCALAEAVAAHVFGAPHRVLSIDVGGIKEPSGISGLLGTPQGYIGHGATLPVHALAERPHTVLLLRGVDAAHEAVRELVARAIRDGYLTDALAKRLPLAQAVVVLEAGAPDRGERSIGFRAVVGVDGAAALDGDPTGGRPAEPNRSTASLADVAVGEALATECDLVVMPPLPAAQGSAGGVAGRAMRRLAAAYRAVGIELAWDAAVEEVLAFAVAVVPARERERVVEARVARAVRPCLRSARRPARVRVFRDGEDLGARLEG